MKKYRPDYNMCADHVPAVWERERNLYFISEQISELDSERIKELDNDKRAMIAAFIYRLEQLKDKISWRAKTKLKGGELTEYYNQFFQRENSEA